MILTRSVLCIVLLFSALGPFALAGLASAARQRDLRLQPIVKEWPATSRRWALIVGVEQYDDPQVARVPRAANDAEAFAKGLSDNAGFHAPRDGLLVFAFAGHGIERRGQAFLVPAGDIKLFEDTAIRVNRIRWWIRTTAVKEVLLVLDTCRNDPPPLAARRPTRAFSYDEANEEVEVFATPYATAVGERDCE